MSSLANLFRDPPPTHVFELSARGLAFAEVAEPAQAGFTPFDAGVLQVSPVHDNIQQPAVVEERVRISIPANGKNYWSNTPDWNSFSPRSLACKLVPFD